MEFMEKSMSLTEKSVKSLESPYIANEVFQVPQQILCLPDEVQVSSFNQTARGKNDSICGRGITLSRGCSFGSILEDRL